MDRIEIGISGRYGLRFIYTDVTETAITLEERHLSGPASSEVLGQGLIAAALLSSKIKEEQERISLQLKVQGPVKGVLAEVSGKGGLRGYTDIKLLNQFDAHENTDLKEILGNHGVLTIIHSNQKGIIYSGQIDMKNPDIRTATAKYFNQSEQIPTGVELFSGMKHFRIEKMNGLMVQKMPGADTEKFVEVLERFQSGEVQQELKNSKGLVDFKQLFLLDELSVLDEKRLQFSCGCSYEKSLSVMGTLSVHELQDIIVKKEPQRVTCHFCGETYRLKPEDIKNVLLDKADIGKPV